MYMYVYMYMYVFIYMNLHTYIHIYICKEYDVDPAIETYEKGRNHGGTY
jgi:hypothetical protein